MLGYEEHSCYPENVTLRAQEGNCFSSASKKCSDYANAFLWNYPFGLTMSGCSANTANPNDNNDITLEFARGFQDGYLERMRYNKAPSYQFANTNIAAPNSTIAWWLTGKSETYSATGYRKYSFHEAVAHEIIYINHYVLGHVNKFSRISLKTNAIKATNKLRKNGAYYRGDISD